ncbi:MAG: hypothetical protein ABR583_02115 [Gaiellaceae bacterium]
MLAGDGLDGQTGAGRARERELARADDGVFAWHNEERRHPQRLDRGVRTCELAEHGDGCALAVRGVVADAVELGLAQRQVGAEADRRVEEHGALAHGTPRVDLEH